MLLFSLTLEETVAPVIKIEYRYQESTEMLIVYFD